jgi:hypothetical protein
MVDPASSCQIDSRVIAAASLASDGLPLSKSGDDRFEPTTATNWAEVKGSDRQRADQASPDNP